MLWRSEEKNGEKRNAYSRPNRQGEIVGSVSSPQVPALCLAPPTTGFRAEGHFTTFFSELLCLSCLHHFRSRCTCALQQSFFRSGLQLLNLSSQVVIFRNHIVSLLHTVVVFFH